MMESRRNQAFNVRTEAAKIAYNREHPEHHANGEELLYRFEEEECAIRKKKPSHLANYTKGLPHNAEDGLIDNPEDYQLFVRAIDSGNVRDFRDTPLGPPPGVKPDQSITWESGYTKLVDKVNVRAWESQGAGQTFDLQGPDAQAVTMPPSPTLDSEELIAEMGEVYEMALLRDIPFANFNDSNPQFQAAIDRLNQLPWFKKQEQNRCELLEVLKNLFSKDEDAQNAVEELSSLSPEEQARRRGTVTAQNAFRGTSAGDNIGPYLSQFLCVGTPELGGGKQTEATAKAGLVQYGALIFQHKVRFATPNKDYMTTWKWWLDVQNGADLRGQENYNPGYRFIATPRDLATYVHYDALYQAYLNACLTMLALKVPFDPGIPFQGRDEIDHQQGFAHFGGPHILSLVTEVATRALKAVRFQKFNIHRRLRPEAVSGRIHRWRNGQNSNLQPIEKLSDRLHSTGLLEEIRKHNMSQNTTFIDGRQEDDELSNSYLLPMAFPEGSPMHPAYGAGHATVAGACTTILKAFFDHGYILPQPYVQPNANGQNLDILPNSSTLDLTVEGELNKIASNISIGRNWAGVHYFTDYYESVRMGEKIAIGILEEQKLTYGENFSMTVPLFDGRTVRI